MEKIEFYWFLKQRGIVDASSVERTLLYFRLKYTERPYRYPGDCQVYLMYKRVLSTGLNLEAAEAHCKVIIDREIAFLDMAASTNLSYQEFFG